MNRAAEIVDFLSNPKNPDVLILAPKAPPVGRADRELSVAIPSVFDAQDVNDTLAAFRTRSLASSADLSMGLSGSFSFGIREVGRFRVNYATQRGSRIVNITRIPHAIPHLSELCEDSATQTRAMSILRDGTPGVMAICGPSALSNALFAYALIQTANESMRKVLYVMERTLTFLVKHENSLVIQCELNTDVKSMEEGVNIASLFEPDIMYLGDIHPSDDLKGITRAVENGVLVMLSSVMIPPRTLCRQYCPQENLPAADDPFATHAFTVRPQGAGKIAIVPVMGITEPS